MSKPAVQYAIFCKEIVTENHTFTIKHAFDSIEVEPLPEYLPLDLMVKTPPITPLTIVLGIVDLTPGPHKILLHVRLPSGRKIEFPSKEAIVKERAVVWRILVSLDLPTPESGIYTFPILLDGEPLAELILPVTLGTQA